LGWRFWKKRKSTWPYYDSDYYKNYQAVVESSDVSWSRSDQQAKASESVSSDDERIIWRDETEEVDLEVEVSENLEVIDLVDSELSQQQELEAGIDEIIESEPDDDELDTKLTELVEKLLLDTAEKPSRGSDKLGESLASYTQAMNELGY
jgi:hypothetical protein